MKNIFLILIGLLLMSLKVDAQTIETIDSLRKSILKNLEQYECLEYKHKEILNEDAVKYDTAKFYRNSENELVYVKWQSRSHTFHISGDGVDITELIFSNGKVVYKRTFGYHFLNSQWHRENSISETKVSVSESIRNYYREDGTPLVEYESREAEGRFADRFNLLDKIPLKPTRKLLWSNRCDQCIEEDYMKVYYEFLNQNNE